MFDLDMNNIDIRRFHAYASFYLIKKYPIVSSLLYPKVARSEHDVPDPNMMYRGHRTAEQLRVADTIVVRAMSWLE